MNRPREKKPISKSLFVNSSTFAQGWAVDLFNQDTSGPLELSVQICKRSCIVEDHCYVCVDWGRGGRLLCYTQTTLPIASDRACAILRTISLCVGETFS